MKIGNNAHLTYCTNIHKGETWPDTFKSMQDHCIAVKNALSPEQPFGIGLRLSNTASIELLQDDHLSKFKTWLDEHDMYVFTMNGFPYGSFHDETVKDKVHSPDWTTQERVDYTSRLFTILAQLLPDDMEGGISTSPLSYRYWHTTNDALDLVKEKSTEHFVSVVEMLVKLNAATGKMMHLDIEPEPDGMLESSDEYIAYFKDYLLQSGAIRLSEILGCSAEQAREYMKKHVQLCYDVCHFAVNYERACDVIQKMADNELLIGKIQISAALKCSAADNVLIADQQACLRTFDEPTYLHQAVMRRADGGLTRFRDLGYGIAAMSSAEFRELRTHFNVPLFTDHYHLLEATQNDIVEALQYWNERPYTAHLEVETYTWEVLPAELQKDLSTSIERELAWVRDQLIYEKHHAKNETPVL